ncbi:MAG TPA: methionine synthase [Candidatus Binatia bacterium]|jgi:5-methyltetrahydropteroyltriglutamate--homocysteine methyltransferase|nr:methionine synthase [Candidatus Binatia bacterium]
MKASLPILPTSVVGSHAKMGWWYLIRQEAEAGRMGSRDVAEALDSAVDVAVLDQERAGVDVITDGEMRRFGSFYRTYLRRIQGIQMQPAEKTLAGPGYHTREVYEVTGKISAPGGLGIVEEFAYLKEHTAKPTKVTCTGPTTFAAGTSITSGYRDQKELAWDFVGIVNKELKALAAAGAEFIQVDEPAFSEIHQDGKELAAIFNATVEGVKAKIAMHICFGNHHGRPLVKRTFRKLFPGVLDAKCDQFVLEFANREMAEIDFWKEVGQRKELGAGLIDQKSFYVETPEDVAERIRIALKYAPAEKLWINPDCGFNPTPRWIALPKLMAMVEGTKIVRRELGHGV